MCRSVAAAAYQFKQQRVAAAVNALVARRAANDEFVLHRHAVVQRNKITSHQFLVGALGVGLRVKLGLPSSRKVPKVFVGLCVVQLLTHLRAQCGGGTSFGQIVLHLQFTGGTLVAAVTLERGKEIGFSAGVALGQPYLIG